MNKKIVKTNKNKFRLKKSSETEKFYLKKKLDINKIPKIIKSQKL